MLFEDGKYRPKTDKQNLKKFGITMGIAFFVITLIVFSRHRHSILPTLIISASFFISAAFMPMVLKPIYILWMRLAFILGWINTRLLLCIIFYLVFTPVAIASRLFRKDPLDRKIEKEKESYWGKREVKPFVPTDYERLF